MPEFQIPPQTFTQMSGGCARPDSSQPLGRSALNLNFNATAQPCRHRPSGELAFSALARANAYLSSSSHHLASSHFYLPLVLKRACDSARGSRRTSSAHVGGLASAPASRRAAPPWPPGARVRWRPLAGKYEPQSGEVAAWRYEASCSSAATGATRARPSVRMLEWGLSEVGDHSVRD